VADDEYICALRDDFAAAALQGMIASGIGAWARSEADKPESAWEVLTRKSYQAADAMLRERAK